MPDKLAIPTKRQLDEAMKNAAEAAAKVGLRLSGLTLGGMSLTFGGPPTAAPPNGSDEFERWKAKHADKTQGN
jgi:hypothetical protein